MDRRIIRIANEAFHQGALLTQADIAILLGESTRTIRRHITELESKGEVIPTRGIIHDIGRVLPHKRIIIRLYTYKKVVKLSKKMGVEEIAQILEMSVSLVKEYVKLMNEVKWMQTLTCGRYEDLPVKWEFGNMKEFVALKLKPLRWTALRLSQDKNIKVFTRLAVPYDPYHPKPYERWTLKGLYDLEKGEILVGEELRDEIDEKFTEFRMGEMD